MEITTTKNGSSLILDIVGRIDTITAPILEKSLKSQWQDIQDLTLNFAEVQYISSAGLRVILEAEKQMRQQGKMTLCNVNEDVMEVFTMTGFDELLTIV